jgi:hypothetical protein
MTNINFVVSNQTEELEVAVLNHIESEFNTSCDFLVLDDNTKEVYAIENQKEMLWAYNTSFIMSHLKDDIEHSNELEESIKMIQEKMCESANGLITAIVNVEEMILEGIQVDGYGHLLSSEDGEEEEFTFEGETYYIYKN